MDLEQLAARADKQAAAIKALTAAVKALREDRDALKARVSALEGSGARASTEPDTATVTVRASRVPGVFLPNPACVICGKGKPPGRTALTCSGCAVEYQRAIKEGPRPSFIKCANCGCAKKGDTRMLCTPCSKSFKVWKANR